MGGDLPEKARTLLHRPTTSKPDSYRPGPFALIYTALLAAGTVAATVVYLVLIHGVPGVATDRDPVRRLIIRHDVRGTRFCRMWRKAKIF